MRSLDKNKRQIWLAKRIGTVMDDYGNQVTEYDKPFNLRINHLPISGDSDTEAYGERFLQIQRAAVDKKTGGLFRENDLVYLDGANPVDRPVWYDAEHERPEPINGDYANYRVQAVRIGLNSTLIYFERLTGRE